MESTQGASIRDRSSKFFHFILGLVAMVLVCFWWLATVILKNDELILIQSFPRCCIVQETVLKGKLHLYMTSRRAHAPKTSCLAVSLLALGLTI